MKIDDRTHPDYDHYLNVGWFPDAKILNYKADTYGERRIATECGEAFPCHLKLDEEFPVGIPDAAPTERINIYELDAEEIGGLEVGSWVRNTTGIEHPLHTQEYYKRWAEARRYNFLP